MVLTSTKYGYESWPVCIIIVTCPLPYKYIGIDWTLIFNCYGSSSCWPSYYYSNSVIPEIWIIIVPINFSWMFWYIVIIILYQSFIICLHNYKRMLQSDLSASLSSYIIYHASNILIINFVSSCTCVHNIMSYIQMLSNSSTVQVSCMSTLILILPL